MITCASSQKFTIWTIVYKLDSGKLSMYAIQDNEVLDDPNNYQGFLNNELEDEINEKYFGRDKY